MAGMTRNNADVLIAGGGFAGLTLAVALRQALGPSFSVTVADPALGKSHSSNSPADDERASAIVAAARRLFETMVFGMLSRQTHSRSSIWW
jgi:2-octaprenyl-6-methoxyphenol hydroxylase